MDPRLSPSPPIPIGQAFAADVRRDLLGSPKRLQPKYLYDALGSRLFDAICELPWYRIPAAERQLLERHAPGIVGGLADPITLVELGCGNGVKLALIAAALARAGRRAEVHLVDVSRAALDATRRALAAVDRLAIVAHETTYEEGLARVAAAARPGGTMLALFLGSNIGNFDPPDARTFLARIARLLGPGGRLLVGADLVKPPPELLLAYDDPLGLTAAFNKNLLVRLNRELGADFALEAFAHRAVWNAAASRMEMHLVSRRRQDVHIAEAGCRVSFEAGETIWTESSYKYEPEEVIRMGADAGLRARDLWIEPDARFCLALFAAGRAR